MKRVAMILFLLFLYAIAFSQDYKIKNVKFEQKGNFIFIFYDLNGVDDKLYNVAITLTDSTGVNVKVNKKSLSGEVGKNIVAGNNKVIEWHLLKDHPSGLHGQGFIFSIEAKLQKKRSKLPYYIGGGVVVVGTVTYLILRGGKDEKLQDPPSWPGN